jgi:hypothetical protein
MTISLLPLPEEPHSLKSVVRALLDQAPETALPLVAAGEWMAEPLWDRWGEALEQRDMSRERFGQIVAGYENELRLWVVGERPWGQVISGLAGRVGRRLAPVETAPSGSEPRRPWQDALGRVGVTPDDAMATLIARIGELHLLYDIAAPNGSGQRSRDTTAASAIVWAGGRPRDPEAPFGEGYSGSSAAALAEALGRFLLKDPAYPPRYASV